MELYKANKGLLYKLARRYAAIDTAVDTDDLVQAGYLGLMEAEKTFDPCGGMSWVGWAMLSVKNAMREAVGVRTTRERAHLHTVSLDEPLSDEEGAETRLDNLADGSIPDASSGLVEAERAATIRAAVDGLATKRSEAIRRYYLEGQSLGETGAALGISLEGVRQARNRGLRDLRKDWRLRRLLDEETHFYRHKGVTAFNTDWTSVTESAALWRIERAQALYGGLGGRESAFGGGR